MQNILTLAHGYSSESTQWELSNEYQDDRVSMFFKKICILVLWTKAASALEGLITHCAVYSNIYRPFNSKNFGNSNPGDLIVYSNLILDASYFKISNNIFR